MKLNQHELEKLSEWPDRLHTKDGIIGYWVDYCEYNNYCRVTKYTLGRELYALLDARIDLRTGIAKSQIGDGRDVADMLFKEVLKIEPKELHVMC